MYYFKYGIVVISTNRVRLGFFGVVFFWFVVCFFEKEWNVYYMYVLLLK